MLVLTACTSPIAQRHQVGTLKLGADLPLSGDDAVDGVPVRDAITLALGSAGSVCGASSHTDACVALQPVMLDDVNKGIHDPATGVANLKTLDRDPGVVGVVGPLYDSVAKAELPVANLAGLALVSPAATDPCLSIEPPDGHCQGLAAHLRPHARNSFFRVVTSELSEPAAAADLIYRSLGKRRAAVVHGASALSQGLATAFALRFTRDGGKIVDQLTADVLYDTETDVAAAAKQRQQLVTTTPGAILAGTDALASDQFAKAAGSAARGCYYTLVGPYPQQTKSAAAFVRQYRQRFGRDASSTSLAAFDATGVLIAAIAGAIDDAGGGLPSRAQVLDALARTSAYSGAMGTFGFDARGDVTLKWVSAYQWLAPTDPVGRFAAEVAAP